MKRGEGIKEAVVVNGSSVGEDHRSEVVAMVLPMVTVSNVGPGSGDEKNKERSKCTGVQAFECMNEKTLDRVGW